MAKIEYTILARNVRKTMNARGDISMELAKVTSKGQITIPVEIRKRLKQIVKIPKIPIIKKCTKTYAWVHYIKLWYASQ